MLKHNPLISLTVLMFILVGSCPSLAEDGVNVISGRIRAIRERLEQFRKEKGLVSAGDVESSSPKSTAGSASIKLSSHSSSTANDSNATSDTKAVSTSNTNTTNKGEEVASDLVKESEALEHRKDVKVIILFQDDPSKSKADSTSAVNGSSVVSDCTKNQDSNFPQSTTKAAKSSAPNSSVSNSSSDSISNKQIDTTKDSLNASKTSTSESSSNPGDYHDKTDKIPTVGAPKASVTPISAPAEVQSPAVDVPKQAFPSPSLLKKSWLEQARRRLAERNKSNSISHLEIIERKLSRDMTSKKQTL